METYTIKEIVEKFGISENEMKYLMRKKSSNKNQTPPTPQALPKTQSVSYFTF